MNKSITKVEEDSPISRLHNALTRQGLSAKKIIEFLAMFHGVIAGKFAIYSYFGTKRDYDSNIKIYIPFADNAQVIRETIESITNSEGESYDQAYYRVRDDPYIVNIICLDKINIFLIKLNPPDTIYDYLSKRSDQLLTIDASAFSNTEFIPSPDGIKLLRERKTSYCGMQKKIASVTHLYLLHRKVCRYYSIAGIVPCNAKGERCTIEELFEEHKCAICHDVGVLDQMLSCSHIFHENCTSKLISYEKGDFIAPYKHQCPICRQNTLPSTPNGLGPSTEVLKTLDLENHLYRICTVCEDVFNAGDKTCEDHSDEFPEKCQLCNTDRPMVKCPNCNLDLEHNGGCSTMTCCLYGHRCSNNLECDHGSSGSIQFCGHVFRIKEAQMNPSDDERDERDERGDDEALTASEMVKLFLLASGLCLIIWLLIKLYEHRAYWHDFNELLNVEISHYLWYGMPYSLNTCSTLLL